MCANKSEEPCPSAEAAARWQYCSWWFKATGWDPEMPAAEREEHLQLWKDAVERSREGDSPASAMRHHLSRMPLAMNRGLRYYKECAAPNTRSLFGDWLSSASGARDGVSWAHVQGLAAKGWPLWFVQSAVRLVRKKAKAVEVVPILRLLLESPAGLPVASWMWDWFRAGGSTSHMVVRVLLFQETQEPFGRRTSGSRLRAWDRIDALWSAYHYHPGDLLKLLRDPKASTRHRRWATNRLWPRFLERQSIDLAVLDSICEHRWAPELRRLSLDELRVTTCIGKLVASQIGHERSANWAAAVLDSLNRDLCGRWLPLVPWSEEVLSLVVGYAFATTVPDLTSNCRLLDCRCSQLDASSWALGSYDWIPHLARFRKRVDLA